jgi:hypothetical protein
MHGDSFHERGRACFECKDEAFFRTPGIARVLA